MLCISPLTILLSLPCLCDLVFNFDFDSLCWCFVLFVLLNVV